jgi:hypothetical protein
VNHPWPWILGIIGDCRFSFGLTYFLNLNVMQGPSILHCNQQKTGLVQRVVNELFESLRSSTSISTWTVKLSMVRYHHYFNVYEVTRPDLSLTCCHFSGGDIFGKSKVSIWSKVFFLFVNYVDDLLMFLRNTYFHLLVSQGPSRLVQRQLTDQGE